jgi:hypothetical protein
MGDRFAAFFGFAWVRFWVVFGLRFNVFNDFWVRLQKTTFPRRQLPAESRLSRAQLRHPLKTHIQISKIAGQRPFRTCPHPASWCFDREDIFEARSGTPEAYTTEIPAKCRILRKALIFGPKYFVIVRDRKFGQLVVPD